jgi:hypothetical protein
MPKIPLQQQSQILNAGSPVPISGTEEARLPGKQVAEFGKGLIDLASGLERANTVKDKAQMDLAMADVERMALDARDKAKGAINENPGMGGMDARNQFVKPIDDYAVEAAKKIDNPAYKMLFQAHAKKYATALGDEVGKFQLEGAIKHTANLNDQTITTIVGMAMANPLRRDEAIIKSREAIDGVGDQIYTPAVKQQLKDSLPKRVDMAIIEQYKTDGNFELARRHVEKYASSFAVEGLDKINDAIDKAEYTYLSHERAAIKFDAYQIDQKKKEARTTNDAVYGMKIFDPNASPLEKKALMDQARNLRFQGLLSPAVMTSFENSWKKGSVEISNKTQVDIYSQALKGLPFAQAEQLVQNAMMKDGFEPGALMAKDGYSLLGRLRALERSPEKKQLELDGEKVTRAAWKQEILDDPTLGAEYKTQMENAVYYYHQLTQKGIDPMTAANQAREKYHKAQFVGIGKGVPVEVADDPEAMKKELNAIPQAYEKALKNGNKDEIKYLDKRSLLLTQQLKVWNEQQIRNRVIKQEKPADKSGGLSDTLKKWFSGGASQ